MTGIDPAVFELFREEARSHSAALGRGLLELEAEPEDATRIEPLMRAAHSLKGAARIVGIDAAVRLAHAMEDVLVAAQHGRIRLRPNDVDGLLQASDRLAALSEAHDLRGLRAWEQTHAAAIEQLEPVLRVLAEGRAPPTLATGSRLEGTAVLPPIDNPQSPPALEPPPPFENPTIPLEPIPLGDVDPLFDQFREEVRASLLALSECVSQLSQIDTRQSDALESLRQLRGAALLMRCDPLADWCAALVEFWQAAAKRAAFNSPTLAYWIHYGIAAVAELIGMDAEAFAVWPAGRGAAALARTAEVLRLAVRNAAAIPTAPPAPRTPVEVSPPVSAPPNTSPTPAEAVVRVTAQSLSRLMGLAGESLVQARWLHHFAEHLLQLRKQHDAFASELDAAYHAAAAGSERGTVAQRLAEVRLRANRCRQVLIDRTNEFDDHAARAEELNGRLYREVISSRMRPFADGLHGLPRLVRDMARALGKQVKLELTGEQTEVDRDILERLEAPLSHLIRNAIDHGIEVPDERTRCGKPAAGTIQVHAGHRAGMFAVAVSDNGCGIDRDRLRSRIVERGLSTAELVAAMSEEELLEFLFLPGFTTTNAVTEFSGRGVGLDVVQDTIRKIGGSVRIATQPGRGTAFHFQLPITLSVIRAVVVEIAGELYAFPHTRIDRLLRVPRAEVRSLEHRQFTTVDDQHVALVFASQLFALPNDDPRGSELPVVLLSDATGYYGLIVDALRGEQDLVVRPLDPRLGKVPDVSAAAILDNGEPVLIADVEDLIRSMDQFIQSGTLRRCEVRPVAVARKKRVLVADDSITVREVERQLLVQLGYEVAVAVDGVDGWNQIRSGTFDLLVTDIDMPRMNGLQLVQAVRADGRLRDVPVIIVSYKERDEDRLRGLEVGANAYLTKSSFHDNRFGETVRDLIGPP